MVNKFQTLTAAIALAAMTVAPALAETRFGAELRCNFRGQCSLGAVAQQIDYRNVEKDSISASEQRIDSAYLGQDFWGNDVYDASGDMVTTTATATTEKSDDIVGASLGIHFPLNENWKKPTVEAKGLVGKTYAHGEAGLGYDFNRDEVTIPVSAHASNFALGTNLRHPVNDLYLGLDSMGPVDKLDKKSTSVVESREALCADSSHLFYRPDFNGTGPDCR